MVLGTSTKNISLVLTPTQIVSRVPQTISLTLYKNISKSYHSLKDMIWNDEAKEKFESATHCHVCKKELNRLVEPIVREEV